MPVPLTCAGNSSYRFLVGVALAFTAACQPLVVGRLTDPARAVAGYGMTLALLGLLLEYVTLVVGRRLGLVCARDRYQATVTWSVLVCATGLLVLNLFANRLSPFFLVQRVPAPAWAVGTVVAAWLLFLVVVARRGTSTQACWLGLAFLILGTRVLVLLAIPFDRLPGDMLAAIDRALEAFLAGEFPYQGLVPRMPYLPALFLAYVPPKFLGWDLRISNLALDGLLVLVAARSARNEYGEGTSCRVPRVNLALLFFLLSPAWVYSSVNTHFAPCVLATAFLGRAVAGQGVYWQALMLGWAVATNQMLLALVPVLFAFWLGRVGLKWAVGLLLMALAVPLVTIGPFLAWNPSQFLAETMARPVPFSAAQMAGRFTLLPLFSGWLPQASMVLSAVIIVLASWVAWRAWDRASLLAVLAVSLCVVLLVQPTSFPHYFLPVLVLAAWASPVPLRTHPRS